MIFGKSFYYFFSTCGFDSFFWEERVGNPGANHLPIFGFYTETFLVAGKSL